VHPFERGRILILSPPASLYKGGRCVNLESWSLCGEIFLSKSKSSNLRNLENHFNLRSMIEKEITIMNKAGMHTRPASAIVRIAAKYKADFYIAKGGFEVNGKSIIGVMTLAAEQGSQLTLQFDGEDEKELSEEMVKFFEEGFGEVI
jgi:phosphocarrier protein